MSNSEIYVFSCVSVQFILEQSYSSIIFCLLFYFFQHVDSSLKIRKMAFVCIPLSMELRVEHIEYMSDDE